MRDPQNDPEVYVVVIGRVIDVDGIEWLVVRNQDGEEFLWDPDPDR